MSNTPHSKLRKEICDYLKSVGAWYVCTNSQGYGRRGIPDVLCCYRGAFLAIEVKVLPDEPNAWQKRELYGDGDKYIGVQQANGITVVAYSLGDVLRVLRNHNPRVIYTAPL